MDLGIDGQSNPPITAANHDPVLNRVRGCIWQWPAVWNLQRACGMCNLHNVVTHGEYEHHFEPVGDTIVIVIMPTQFTSYSDPCEYPMHKSSSELSQVLSADPRQKVCVVAGPPVP